MRLQLARLVGNETYESAKRKPNATKSKGDQWPTLSHPDTGDPERGTANNADQDLTSNLCSERLATIQPYQKGRTNGSDH